MNGELEVLKKMGYANGLKYKYYIILNLGYREISNPYLIARNININRIKYNKLMDKYNIHFDSKSIGLLI